MPASDIDALFELPLSEFVAARNALAAQLKKSGRESDADEVKSLAKPSVSAWTINQLYWRHRAAFERLMNAGERFRNAQAAQLAGETTNIRDPLSAQREALAELARHAADTLREADHLPTPDKMRRITMTLEALAAYAGIPDGPAAGRLTSDVDPPSFETLAALVPRAGKILRAGKPSNRVLSFPNQTDERKQLRKLDPEERQRRLEEERKAQRAEAKTAVQEAERALREARKAVEQAEAALKKAAAHAKETEQQKREAEQRIEKIVAAAEAARQEARRVAAEAESATQTVEDAERALSKARAELERLS